MTRRRGLLSLLLALLALPSTSRAQARPATPPASNTAAPSSAGAPPAAGSAVASPPVPSPGSVPAIASPPALVAPFPLDAWLIRYQAARELFFAGRFDEAARDLLALAAVAPEPTGAFAARELGVMAAEWHRRGLQLASGEALRRGASGGRDRSRRTGDEIASLYGYSVVYGLGTGLWIASLSEPDSPAGVILPALGLAGLSAGVVATLDRGKGMSYGVPQSIQAGLTLGFLQGVFWTSWNQARVRSDKEWEVKTVTTLLWGASTAGAVAGGVLGSRYGTTPGRASFVSSAGLWTGTVGGLLAAAVTADEESSKRDDNGLLVAALGLNLGAGLGVWQAGSVSPSIARVRFIDLGGVAGGLVVGGLYLAASDQNSSDRGLAGMTALGMAGGLGLAFQLTRGMEADRPEEAPAGVDARASITPVRGGFSLGLNGSW